MVAQLTGLQRNPGGIILGSPDAFFFNAVPLKIFWGTGMHGKFRVSSVIKYDCFKVQMKCFFLFQNLKEQQKSGITVSSSSRVIKV